MHAARDLWHRPTGHTLTLTISPSGRYLSARGSALELVGGPLTGRTIEEVLAEWPEVIELWRRQLRRRQPFVRMVEAFGVHWLIDAEPLLDESGRYVGMSALVTMYGAGGEAPRLSVVEVQEWVCTRPLRAGPMLVLPGEVVVDDGDRVTICRSAPSVALTPLRQQYGGPALRRPVPAAASDAPPASGSPRPHLRVM